MSPTVVARPRSLVRIRARSGANGLSQSSPVEARRCTLSTTTSRITSVKAVIPRMASTLSCCENERLRRKKSVPSKAPRPIRLRPKWVTDAGRRGFASETLPLSMSAKVYSTRGRWRLYKPAPWVRRGVWPCCFLPLRGERTISCRFCSYIVRVSSSPRLSWRCCSGSMRWVSYRASSSAVRSPTAWAGARSCCRRPSWPSRARASSGGARRASGCSSRAASWSGWARGPRSAPAPHGFRTSPTARRPAPGLAARQSPCRAGSGAVRS